MHRECRKAAMLFGASLAFQALFITLDAFVADEGIVLVAADDLASGRLLYRDINVPLTPAVYLLQGLVFKVFGSSVLLSRLLITATNAFCVGLVYSLARCLLSSRRAIWAGILAIPLQIWMWPHAQYFSYNSLAVLLALLAIRVAWSIEVAPNRRRNALFLGAVFAAGIFTKPNIPLAVGVGVLLYWLSVWLRTWLGWAHERPREFKLLWREGWTVLTGLCVASLPMIAYLAGLGILDDMVQNIIAIANIYDDSPQNLFPSPWPLAEQIDSVRTNPGLVLPGMLVNGMQGFAAHHGYQYLLDYTGLIDILVRLAYYLPVALIVSVALVLGRRLSTGSWGKTDEAALLSFIAALSLYLTNYSFPALHYVVPTLLPWVALSLYAGFSVLDSSSGAARKLLQGGGLAVVAAYLLASGAALSTYLGVPRAPVHTARGTVWVERTTAKLWNEIIAYTTSRISEQDQIYVVPYFPLFYFLTERDHPTRFVALGPGLPGPSAENEIIDQLEREQVAYVLYTPGQEFPGLEEFKNAYPRLHEYIRRHFELEREFHSLFGVYAELMHRTAAPRREIERTTSRHLGSSSPQMDEESVLFSGRSQGRVSMLESMR